MRAVFHSELDKLITELATMTRRCAGLMTAASTALHQTDLPLAELVIADADQLTAMLTKIQARCVSMLALQAPVATDLRVPVAALHAQNHLQRMGKLAQHIAKIIRLRHPRPTMVSEVRPVCARMGLLASQLAVDAATGLEQRDPRCADQLANVEDEIDALRRGLFSIVFAPNWPHGVQPAIDTALIGRYYERFADHAMALAAQACYVATGRIPQSPA